MRLQVSLLILSNLGLGVQAFVPTTITTPKDNSLRWISNNHEGQQRTATTDLFGATSDDDDHRVVVTGLGVISGCGIGHEAFFQNCLDGKSSLRKVERFDSTHYPCQIASEVPDDMFVAADFFVNPKNAKSNDRYTHFAVAAARLALKDAQLGDTPETLPNPARVGCMVGTAFGGMETFERETLKLAQKPDRPKVRTSILLCMWLWV